MTIELEFYAILGVSQDANFAHIRTAYRARARELHPDMPNGDAEAFIKLNSAYATLSDPEARRLYDETGEAKGEFDPLKFQESVILSIAELFDMVLKLALKGGFDVDGIQFLATMRDMCKAALDESEKKAHRAQMNLRQMEKLRKRITRKGEEANVFADMIDKRIIEETANVKDARLNLKIARRVLDELENYEEASSVMRAAQAARYYSQPSQSGGNFWSSIVPC